MAPIYSVCFMSIILAFVKCANALNTPTKNENSTPKKIEVVIFLVNTNFSSDAPIGNAVKYLKMKQVAMLKPCSKNNNRQKLENSEEHCDCSEKLSSNLDNLMAYSSDTLGLSTAMAQLNKDFSRKIFEEENSDFINFNLLGQETQTHTDRIEQPLEYYDKESIGSLPLKQEEDLPIGDLPLLKRLPNEDADKIPLFEAFPNPEAKPFNNINKWEKRQRRIKRQISGRSQDTEIFYPNSRKKENKQASAKHATPNEVADVPVLVVRPKSIWDVLGLMSAMKQSFFNSFFDPLLDPRLQRSEEEGLNLDRLGKIHDPFIFNFVRTNLNNLQQNKNGFMMTIVGGEFGDISKPYSDLMQSVKYVAENADEDTLLILTGCCPNNEDMEASGGVRKKGLNTIPLFAKGKNKNLLAGARNLQDLPLYIRQAMTKTVNQRQTNSAEYFLKYLDVGDEINFENIDKEGKKIRKRGVEVVTVRDPSQKNNSVRLGIHLAVIYGVLLLLL